MSEKNEHRLVLPVGIVTPADLGRLIRELDQTNEAMEQAGLRKGGDAISLPKPTRLMNELCESNDINLLHADDRRKLSKLMGKLKVEAPVLSISFNTDPASSFTQKLVTWLRQEMHPQMLLRIGLQPNIGAGCVVRTTNHYFDFSLRRLLDDQQSLLTDKLAVSAKGKS